MRLTIESTDDNDPAAKPDTSADAKPDQDKDQAHDLDSISDMYTALRACWVPPPKDEARHGMQYSVRFSFKRDGAIIATPRVTYASHDAPPEVRDIYRDAVNAALDRCTPLHFTDGHGRRRRRPPDRHPLRRQPHHRKPKRQHKRGAMTASPDDTLILETTKGRVVIAMRPDLAPGHVARIKELVREGFYDGIVFHRVIDGFMAQTGCPQGTGTGGSGQKLKAEFNKEPHVRGTVSMARAQNPDSGDSQFFICFDDARFLDNQYTAWGNVTEGMDNVDKIKRGEPVQNPDKIVSAKMAADA